MKIEAHETTIQIELDEPVEPGTRILIPRWCPAMTEDGQVICRRAHVVVSIESGPFGVSWLGKHRQVYTAWRADVRRVVEA